jgi:hypothetical protein
VKEGNHGRSESRLILRERTSKFLLCGSQASPSDPSDKGNMKMAALMWLELAVCERGPRGNI